MTATLSMQTVLLLLSAKCHLLPPPSTSISRQQAKTAGGVIIQPCAPLLHNPALSDQHSCPQSQHQPSSCSSTGTGSQIHPTAGTRSLLKTKPLLHTLTTYSAHGPHSTLAPHQAATPTRLATAAAVGRTAAPAPATAAATQVLAAAAAAASAIQAPAAARLLLPGQCSAAFASTCTQPAAWSRRTNL